MDNVNDISVNQKEYNIGDTNNDTDMDIEDGCAAEDLFLNGNGLTYK